MSALVERVVEDSAPAAAPPPPPPLAFDQYCVTSAAALAFSCAARSSTVGAAACCASTLSSSARRFLRISSRVVEPERPSASTRAAQWRTASAMDASVLVYCVWRTPSRRSSSELLLGASAAIVRLRSAVRECHQSQTGCCYCPQVFDAVERSCEVRRCAPRRLLAPRAPAPRPSRAAHNYTQLARS